MLAHFADGSVRDVTRLTAFSSSDDGIAEVDANGLVELQQTGEAAILCRYLDVIECVRLTYLEPRKDFAWPNPPEHNYVDRHVFAKLKLLNIAALGAVHRPGIPPPGVSRPVRHPADARGGPSLPGRHVRRQAGRADRSAAGAAGVRRLLGAQMAGSCCAATA